MKKAANYLHQIVSIVLIVCFISPASYASSPICSVNYQAINKTSKNLEWSQKAENVFSESFTATLASSAIWLTAVQAIKVQLLYQGDMQAFWNSAFIHTFALDIFLTLTTHGVALIESPRIKRIFEGKFLGTSGEFIAKSSVNIGIGISSILATWAISPSINLNTPNVTAAFLLCLLVYPTLQVTKPYLFKTLPKKDSVRSFKTFSIQFPGLFKALEPAFRSKAEQINLESKEFKELFVKVLTYLSFSTKFEERPLPNFLKTDPSLAKNISRIEEIKAQIKLLDATKTKNLSKKEKDKLEAQLAKSAKELNELRISFVKKILEYKKWVQSPKDKLALQNLIKPDLYKDSSLETFELYRFLIKEHESYKDRIYISSLIDQKLAVGIAGGFLLYSTNHFAQFGSMPAFWGF
ncbi:MAG: hypothetical protein AB8E15_00505 [Bdellovibrionales bacterium]